MERSSLARTAGQHRAVQRGPDQALMKDASADHARGAGDLPVFRRAQNDRSSKTFALAEKT